MNHLPSMNLWQQFHWSFFVNTQGLIVSLGRFEKAIVDGNIPLAKIELDCSSDLLLASAASMELAGSFTSEEYEGDVRPTMTESAVGIDNFSGLMSWDHSTLIQLWRRLKRVFDNLPEELNESHEKFLEAYRVLAVSHRAVCSQFGGADGGSLRHKKAVAVEVLDRIEQNRRGMIGCPMHQQRGGKPSS